MKRLHVLLTVALCSSIACTKTESKPPPAPSYGTAMAEVGRRFELIGRAGEGARYDLADFELGEIEEQFTETLPIAELPKEGHPDVLPARVKEFSKTTIPDLKTAIASHDHAMIAAAYARTAAACNGCHQASGHGFIEVPAVMGHAVPNTDPVP